MSRRGAKSPDVTLPLWGMAGWGLVPVAAATIIVAVLGLVVGNQRTLATEHDNVTPRATAAPTEQAHVSSSFGQAGTVVAPTDRPTIKRMLYQAARVQGVNPGLVMGVAWWESGWDQSAVSSTGAVGIMQVEPYTADADGPRLLGRPVDIHQLAANIELGTAILKDNLDRYHGDIAKALAAYYAGPAAVDDWAPLNPDVRRYVVGIYKLAVAFDRGTGPV